MGRKSDREKAIEGGERPKENRNAGLFKNSYEKGKRVETPFTRGIWVKGDALLGKAP